MILALDNIVVVLDSVVGEDGVVNSVVTSWSLVVCGFGLTCVESVVK